ncbi:hypothetical protein OPT61_g10332 [Boeremia exigua]|uniref:Uncharacterized protein n=1 Tax=Boeremia exigua TaxID=749465 RepID=A0ACC2HQQ7_9PLEO|nr:hypothetical protein OPT61_g10332 [Boeremia exigua]
MPSFAFWKSAKPDETKAPLLSDAAVKEELSLIIPNVSKAVDLNPGNQDSGVFLFDDDAQEIPGDQTPIVEPASTIPELISTHDDAPTQHSSSEESLLDISEPSPNSQSPALVPEVSSPRISSDTSSVVVERESVPEVDIEAEELPQTQTPVPEASSPTVSLSTAEPSQEHDDSPPSPSQHVSPVPKELGPILSVEKTAHAALVKVDTNVRNQDSAVYMADESSPAASPAASRPSSIASIDNAALRRRVSSLSKPATAAPQRTNSIARLQRPAELNLGFNSAPDSAKPKTV